MVKNIYIRSIKLHQQTFICVLRIMCVKERLDWRFVMCFYE